MAEPEGPQVPIHVMKFQDHLNLLRINVSFGNVPFEQIQKTVQGNKLTVTCPDFKTLEIELPADLKVEVESMKSNFVEGILLISFAATKVEAPQQAAQEDGPQRAAFGGFGAPRAGGFGAA